MAAGELGRLLNRMIETLKARQGWTMEYTLDHLGRTLGVSSSTLYKWRQGRHRPDVDTLARLVEIGVAEAGMDQTWAERILYQGEHPQRAAILHRLFQSVEAPVRHNLPRRPYVRLVGRDAELAEVIHRLIPESRHWLVPIEGIGGVGKSALAMEVGWRFVEGYDRLPLGRRFDAVVWASAKREVLNTTGVETRHPTLTNLDDVYHAIAEVLDYPAILRAPRQDQFREMEKALRRGGRVLLILDNLETVDDPQVLAFLRDLPPPAKAVATMRFHEDMPYPIRLKELDQAAARELAAQECASRGIALRSDEMDRLLEYTRGLPLAIWWAVGLMGMEGFGVKAALEHLREPKGDLLRFIFEQAADRLRTGRPETYHTLLALTFFDLDSGGALLPLATTVGLDEEATRTALHRLLNLNLVNRTETGDRLTLLPLTHDFACAELATMTVWEHEARERWAGWYVNLVSGSALGNLPMARWTPLETLVPLYDRIASSAKLRVEEELGNILALFRWYQDNERYEELSSLFRELAPFLFAEGFWEAALSHGKQVAEWAHAVDDLELFVWCAVEVVVRIHTHQGKHDQAADWLERAHITVPRHRKKHEREHLLAATLYSKGALVSKQGYYTEAEQKFTRALEIYRRIDDKSSVARCLNHLGNTYLRRKLLPEAQRYYEESLAVWESLDPSSPDVIDGIAAAKGNLGIVASRDGRYEKARDILYSIERLFTWQTDLAELYIELAIAEYHLGNLEQAQGLGHRAESIMTRLGLARPLWEADEEWLQLKAEGKVS